MATKWVFTSLKLYVLHDFHNVMNSEDIYHIETINLQPTLGWEKLTQVLKILKDQNEIWTKIQDMYVQQFSDLSKFWQKSAN